MSRQITHHRLTCDILIAGGGPSGVPCAIAAARGGAKVILCQDRHVLGGNASSEVRMHIVGADCSGYRSPDRSIEAREGGLIEEIRLETALRNPQRSPSMLDLILYDMCQNEPNLTLMLNTTVVGVTMDGDRIASAKAVRESTEDHFEIQAKIFIDCTGDGRLGAEAGADYREGREAQSEFGEPRALPEADNFRLGSTLLFMARKHDRPMPFQAPTWARRFTEHDLRLRPHASPGKIDEGLEYGYWWVEWGGHLDTIKDNEAIRDELLAIVMGVWDHVKNGDPTKQDYPNPQSHGASHWALDWFSFLPGKRESRRFIGQYVLTQNDLLEAPRFEDAIAFGGWPVDVHPPHGVDAIDETPSNHSDVPHLYEIPLRCFVSRNIENLCFVGRNMSATHLAFASTRVMATCAVMGQGVGTAMAYAIRHQLPPQSLASHPAAMQAIQQQLLRDDAYLIGITNQDPQDLARQARCSASSHQVGAGPEQVLSGQTRSVHGERGAPPDRALPGAHRWMSDPAEGLPASLCLHWDEPVCLQQIQLTFDTGLSRPLTLSQSDGYVKLMTWGRIQPETISDYRLEARLHPQGPWQLLAEVHGHYQRRRVHDLAEPVTISELRLTALATGGLDHARLMEIRAYGPDAGVQRPGSNDLI